jgi:MFS family permease
MPSRRPSLGVIFLTVMIDLLGFGIVMPFLTLQARDAFHVSETTAIFLGATYSAMQFLCMPLWGRLSDRIGRRPVMLLSICGSCLSMAALASALAWSDSIFWLFAARAASGISTANIGTASAYIADITTPEERVKGMGLIGMAFGLGFLIGPGIGGALSQLPINGREGPTACFVAAGLSAINLVWAFTSLPESLPKERRRSDHVRSMSPVRFDLLARTLGKVGVGRAIITNHLIILAFSGLEITYALYAADAFELSQGWISALFVYMGLIGALVQGVFMRRASGRYRETSLIYVGLSLLMVGFLGFVVAPSLGFAALWVVSAMIAIGNGFTQPSISAYISRLTDASTQGESLSANQSMSSLGRTFGPLLAGLLYAYAPMVPFMGCAVINAVALYVSLGMRSVQPVTTIAAAPLSEA